MNVRKDLALCTRNAMNGIFKYDTHYSFLKMEIKGLYELIILMNIRYNLQTMSIQEVSAMIYGNLGLHELSYVSFYPKNNCPEQIRCKHGKRKHAFVLNTVLAVGGPILWSPL